MVLDGGVNAGVVPGELAATMDAFDVFVVVAVRWLEGSWTGGEWCVVP